MHKVELSFTEDQMVAFLRRRGYEVRRVRRPVLRETTNYELVEEVLEVWGVTTPSTPFEEPVVAWDALDWLRAAFRRALTEALLEL